MVSLAENLFWVYVTGTGLKLAAQTICALSLRVCATLCAMSIVWPPNGISECCDATLNKNSDSIVQSSGLFLEIGVYPSYAAVDAAGHCIATTHFRPNNNQQWNVDSSFLFYFSPFLSRLCDNTLSPVCVCSCPLSIVSCKVNRIWTTHTHTHTKVMDWAMSTKQ